jgi:hypothetical protein
MGVSEANDMPGGGPDNYCARSYPHPAGLRPATLPTRGRDKIAPQHAIAVPLH